MKERTTGYYLQFSDSIRKRQSWKQARAVAKPQPIGAKSDPGSPGHEELAALGFLPPIKAESGIPTGCSLHSR